MASGKSWLIPSLTHIMVPAAQPAENSHRTPAARPLIRGHTMSEHASTEHPVYNYAVVRQFTIMTVVWGIVGMLVGVLIAAQLAFPELNVA